MNGGEVGVALQGSGELWARGSFLDAWDPRVLAIPPVRDARAGLRPVCAVTFDDVVYCAGQAVFHELGVAQAVTPGSRCCVSGWVRAAAGNQPFFGVAAVGVE